MPTFAYPLSMRYDRIAEAVNQAIVSTVAPALLAAVDQAAASIAEGFNDDNPYTRYVIAEKLVEEVASLLMMSDVSDTDVLRPHMLAPEYLSYFYPNVGKDSESRHE